MIAEALKRARIAFWLTYGSRCSFPKEPFATRKKAAAVKAYAAASVSRESVR